MLCSLTDPAGMLTHVGTFCTTRVISVTIQIPFVSTDDREEDLTYTVPSWLMGPPAELGGGHTVRPGGASRALIEHSWAGSECLV